MGRNRNRNQEVNLQQDQFSHLSKYKTMQNTDSSQKQVKRMCSPVTRILQAK